MSSRCSYEIKAQNLEKAPKEAHIPYILACHLQIDANPNPDPAYHCDADPDPTFQFYADPDLQHWETAFRDTSPMGRTVSYKERKI